MKQLLPFFFVFTAAISWAQIHENFKLQRIDNKVYISWTIKEGNTCNGIQVQRSTNDSDFVTIHDIQGVCGSPEKKVFYDYTDTTPEIGVKNDYRLLLGTNGTSEIVSIEMKKVLIDEIEIYPNPASNIITVNYGKVYTKLSVFDLKGNTVYSQMLDESYQTTISESALETGVYLFSFHNEEGIAVTRKVVIN